MVGIMVLEGRKNGVKEKRQVAKGEKAQIEKAKFYFQIGEIALFKS